MMRGARIVALAAVLTVAGAAAPLAQATAGVAIGENKPAMAGGVFPNASNAGPWRLQCFQEGQKIIERGGLTDLALPTKPPLAQFGDASGRAAAVTLIESGTTLCLITPEGATR